MPDGQHTDGPDAIDGANLVALKALSQLKLPLQGSGDMLAPLESYIIQMTDAVLADDQMAIHNVVRMMRKARMTSAIIAESYVPEVARRLGDAWVADTLNFGAVTIGSARLQGLLRSLTVGWDIGLDDIAYDRAPYLVGVPHGSQHTLGATVLAGALRHRGISVNLIGELTPASIFAELQQQEYKGILISASHIAHLEPSRDLVDQVRQAGRNTPVLIGGSILEHTVDIQSFTRADLVTGDVDEAITFCEECALDADVRGPDGARL